MTLMTKSTLARRGKIDSRIFALLGDKILFEKKAVRVQVLNFNPFFQTYVNGEDKDDKYWERREKNNMAARRSREVLLNKSQLSHQ